MNDLSEEMKMILALLDQLNLVIKATGDGISANTPVDDTIFTRDKKGEYTYTVTPSGG